MGAIHRRYLGNAPTGVLARVDRLAKLLKGAQAAQARGSPEALDRAAADISMLSHSTCILAKNCEFYGDVLEGVGFTVDDELDDMATALLSVLDRVQSLHEAVSRLKAAAEMHPGAAVSCRRQLVEADDDSS